MGLIARYLFSTLSIVTSLVSCDFASTLRDTESLSQFAQLLGNYTDVYGALSWSQSFTLLAPSNDAMEKIPYTSLNRYFSNNETAFIRQLLQYHVLQGMIRSEMLNGDLGFYPTWLRESDGEIPVGVTGGQRVALVRQPGDLEDVVTVVSGGGARSTVTDANIDAENCIIHIVDSVLIPPMGWYNTSSAYDLDAASGFFTAAGSTPDNFTDVTVFAPKNSAFQRINSVWSDMGNATLRETAGYHVVPNNLLYSSDLVNGTRLNTTSGEEVTIWFFGGQTYVNSAKIVQADLLFSNGAIHVIDNVLSPNATSVLPDPQIATQAPVIAGSLVSSEIRDIPFTSYIPCLSDCPVPSSTETFMPTTTRSTRTTSATGFAATSSGACPGQTYAPVGLIGGVAMGILGVI
ncbi:Fasciclin-domain-containing protein [Patellaria atrata CBS 101060]|uniref:Fasciclin-domain-containing protein n=1 Tax=Patellaria atrata CBS 101060 TaxID=1346257 RepID=A0A9P4VKD9_9PEZI|nr:Fasciclin-domain-containing protein [Patellaria atrata CBS 101060]